MICKNCGGELRLENGVALCTSCNTTYKIDGVFEPVDVYLCYVENDDAGRRTKDSIVAQELYQKLEARKIHTFFERISASTAYGDELELLRYNAMHTAKIVLVVGTNATYFNEIHEKYGKRFEGKVIIPFCVDIKPADIPPTFSKIQAMDYTSIGWERDLELGALRVLGREKEIDLAEVNAKAKKLRITLISIGAAVLVLLAGVLAFLSLNNEMPSSTPLTSQEMYDKALAFAQDGDYVSALDMYSKITEYKDTKEQMKTIYDRYDGYYLSKDEKFSVYLNIKNARELSLEMLTLSKDGKITTTVEGVWSGIKQTYSFMDSFGNAGNATITLTNDGFRLVVKMEESGDFTSIGKRDETFLLAKKSDKPALLQVTDKMLRTWISEPTTVKDIKALGFELVKDSNYQVTAGGGTVSGADLYRIADTDIELFMLKHDPADNKGLYYSGEASKAKQIVCAVFAPAENLAPNKIGKKNGTFLENDILYVTGSDDMDIDWNGVDIQVYYENRESDRDEFSGTIAANTMVGAFSKKIVGTGFFIRGVMYYCENMKSANIRYMGELDGQLLCTVDDTELKLCYLNKKTYKIEKECPCEIVYLWEDKTAIAYSEPDTTSKKLKTYTAKDAELVVIETTYDDDGVEWGKLATGGWIVMPEEDGF